MNVGDIFGDLPTLETERLILRPLLPKDVDDVFAYTSDPEVARYTSWQAHGSREQTAGFVGWIVGKYLRGEVAPWGVEHRTDRRIIGTCGFDSWSIDNERAEVGYAMARPYWGQGLTTEAVREVIRFGFERMALNRIEAPCIPENVGSWRVMEKVGMRRESVLRQYLRHHTGSFVDIAYHAILRDEWRPD